MQLDLRHLVLNHEWDQPSEDVWHCPATGCRLEQSSVDPMRIILHIPVEKATTKVWIHVPRMYPHRPPTVSRIQHAPGSPCAHITTVKFSTENEGTHLLETTSNRAGESSQQHPFVIPTKELSSILTFPQWTCILRLVDILEFLQASLGGCKNANRNACWATAPPMPDARGFLVPGRFDVGFYKGDANDMDLKD
jgi:hypothetical protein